MDGLLHPPARRIVGGLVMVMVVLLAFPPDPVAAADTTAPSVPVGVGGSVGSSSISMTWAAATDDVGVRGYLVHRDGQFRAWIPSGTSYTDTTVTVGVAYRYEIRAQDAAGNNSAPSAPLILGIGVGPPPSNDTVPPSSPTNVVAQSGDTNVALTWSPATDNVGVSGYLVHRDGQFLAWVPGSTSYTDGAVTLGQTYRYEIRAQDAAHNNSVSAPVTVTVGATVDPPLGGLVGLIVTSWGNDTTADGSAARPFRTVSVAVNRATTGMTVWVSNGVYRETVSITGRSLLLRAVPGAEPVLSGADRATSWTASSGRWWTQGTGFPDTGWPTGMVQSPVSGLVDIVVFDGTQLRQVTSSSQVAADTFWVDGSERVWIGRDPGGHIVEVARRTRGLYARDVNGFFVEGLTFQHYASGPGDMGAVEIWGPRTVLRDVWVHDNANAGIRLIGATVAIESSRAERNGRVGALLHNADNGVVRNSVFSGNNTEGFHPFGASGGVKITASRTVAIRDNQVNDNVGHGIWFDLSSVGITIDSNTASRNSEAGIHVEVSAQAAVSDNVADDNGRGIYIVETNDVQVTGNQTSFNERNILVLDGYRDGNGCVDREVGAVHTPPIDSRYGCQWPTVKWNIDNLVIANNTVVGGSPGYTYAAMIEINHVAYPDRDIGGEDRRVSAEAMHVTIGANQFRRTTAGVPQWVIGWSQWPAYMAAYETLAAFMASTGQAAGSTYSGP